MIELEHVSKAFQQSGRVVTALDDVSLRVERGEIFGVLGPSGAGKSTLIRCVNLLERPDTGSIRLNGSDLTRLAPADLRRARQRIGMIFQHFNLLSSRTVAGNVAFPLEISGMLRADLNRRVDELLELVGLTDKANAYPAQLSGGQKQRVGIARALANQPDLLLSDEATSALDPASTDAILNLLRNLNHRLGLTILLITHEMNVVRQICDRAAVLQDGRIVEQGAVGDLAARPNSLLARALFPALESCAVRPGALCVTLTFVGDSANRPVLADLIRRFEIEVNILGGSIQTAGGRRVGQLQLEITGPQSVIALAHLQDQGLHLEVH